MRELTGILKILIWYTKSSDGIVRGRTKILRYTKNSNDVIRSLTDIVKILKGTV